MHTALIGASRGIGRATALDLLQDETNTVSLLLRSPASIEDDAGFASAIEQGRVRIVKGNANDKADLRRLLDYDRIDSVVFTLGAVYPDGKRQFSWSKGFLLPSLDVCTSATLRLVQVIDELVREGRKAPAVVAISVTGVGKSAVYLPYMYKVSTPEGPGVEEGRESTDAQLVLPWLLQQTIADKRGLEYILSHVSSSLALEPDTPAPDVLPSNALDGLSRGFLQEVLVVRPAQLKDTDGTKPLRAAEDVSTYSTGRIELGRWIAAALRDRATWMNRRVTVGA